MNDQNKSKLDNNFGKKGLLGKQVDSQNNVKRINMNHQANIQVDISKEGMRAVQFLSFMDDLCSEFETASADFAPSPELRMVNFLMESHFAAKTVTPTSLIAASGAPYATANRRMLVLIEDGLVEKRPRTSSGRSFSLHPSENLLQIWLTMVERIWRLAQTRFGDRTHSTAAKDYYFGGSYMEAKRIPPLQILSKPLKLAGGLRVLVHGDPTFMVMENLKRQFEQIIGTQIHQRAFSIDRLRVEALRNAERKASLYDIVAVDLPWIGEFAEKKVLMPLDEVMDIERLDPADFHPVGWKAAHWGGRPYGVPAQTTPELLFYRRDLFEEADLAPPATTDELIHAARYFHQPDRGRYGIAWNAARGTALGHTVLMTLADFGQPLVDLPKIAGGFNTDVLSNRGLNLRLYSEAGQRAAEFLLNLLEYSPPDILSMSWYERIKPYAAGKVAMAYGYTLLAPYFEMNKNSPAHDHTGYLPHPPAPGAQPVAPVGGYVMGIPATVPPERREAAVEALLVFTSPQAQKLYVQNGSRTNPRYSVGSDPEVRRASPIFEAVDSMSWRDELQFWPRPPIPEIPAIIQICGEEFHDMLRGLQPVNITLEKAQQRCEAVLRGQNN